MKNNPFWKMEVLIKITQTFVKWKFISISSWHVLDWFIGSFEYSKWIKLLWKISWDDDGLQCQDGRYKLWVYEKNRQWSRRKFLDWFPYLFILFSFYQFLDLIVPGSNGMGRSWLTAPQEEWLKGWNCKNGYKKLSDIMLRIFAIEEQTLFCWFWLKQGALPIQFSRIWTLKN